MNNKANSDSQYKAELFKAHLEFVDYFMHATILRISEELNIPKHVVQQLVITAFMSSTAIDEARALPLIRDFIMERFNVDIFNEFAKFVSEGFNPRDIRIIVKDKPIILVEVGIHKSKAIYKKLRDMRDFDKLYNKILEEIRSVKATPVYWIHVDIRKMKITRVVQIWPKNEACRPVENNV
jgi:preprotein translocase subunit SecA